MMDHCTKFKVFILLIFCVANFFIYHLVSVPSSMSTSVWKTIAIHTVPDKLTTNTFFMNKDNGDSDSNQSKPSNPGLSVGATSSVVTSSKAGTNVTIDTSNGGPVIVKAVVDATSVTLPPTSSPALPQCPLVPPNLLGALATYKEALSFDRTKAQNEGLQPGGLYKPPNCVARHRVAVIIPYRNREEHLKILLNNIHPILRRQQLDYGIYVVDQALPGRFNRAMLMNIGYAEAMKRYDYQCAVFHDVDLIPENDRNIYSCPAQPRHLSAAIDKHNYRLPYTRIFGGVSALRKEHMVKVNGFSNMYFGWGGEDDDMASRIGHNGLKITRYPPEIARYKMIKHTRDKQNEKNPKRFDLLRTAKQRIQSDGLNSLQYEVQQVDKLPTHTRLLVLIDESKMSKSLPSPKFPHR